MGGPPGWREDGDTLTALPCPAPCAPRRLNWVAARSAAQGPAPCYPVRPPRLLPCPALPCAALPCRALPSASFSPESSQVVVHCTGAYAEMTFRGGIMPRFLPTYRLITCSLPTFPKVPFGRQNLLGGS